jgi:hypothetical protein
VNWRLAHVAISRDRRSDLHQPQAQPPPWIGTSHIEPQSISPAPRPRPLRRSSDLHHARTTSASGSEPRDDLARNDVRDCRGSRFGAGASETPWPRGSEPRSFRFRHHRRSVCALKNLLVGQGSLPARTLESTSPPSYLSPMGPAACLLLSRRSAVSELQLAADVLRNGAPVGQIRGCDIFDGQTKGFENGDIAR